MCSDSYPIPLVSFLFIPSLYPLLFNSKNISFFSSKVEENNEENTSSLIMIYYGHLHPAVIDQTTKLREEMKKTPVV